MDHVAAQRLVTDHHAWSRALKPFKASRRRGSAICRLPKPDGW